MVMVHAPFAMAAVMLLTAAIAPVIAVTEKGGAYHVRAEFTVPASPGTVTSVLMDFDRIAEFMPDVKRSQVLERTSSGLLVEQEAAATFMMFTKRIHLILEVSEDGGTIRFRDRCGKSFAQYEGAWRLKPQGEQTMIEYELTARPSFEVPGFVLKRLLKRDAAAMIDQLTAEIAGRQPASK
jgi:ribosome-associated toxin RatA of RatAB toxin-antitoxin module